MVSRRATVRWPEAFALGLLCSAVLSARLLGQGDALPAGASALASSLRLGTVERIHGDPGAEVVRVRVPVLLGGYGAVDVVQFSVDFDGRFLQYVDVAPAAGEWRLSLVEGVIVQPIGRLMGRVIRSSGPPRGPPDGRETPILELVFDVSVGELPADSYRLFFPLRFTQFSPTSLTQTPREETFAARLTGTEQDWAFEVVPSSQIGGSVAIYYASAAEIGSGSLTAREQTFTLPLYFTYLGNESIDLIRVGVDYDELILRLEGVVGRVAAAAEGDPSTVELPFSRQSDGSGVEFVLELAENLDQASGPYLRAHVADLTFRYLGVAESAGDALEISPSVRIVEPSEGGGAGRVAAVSGVLRFLDAYFVRGNADSSLSGGPIRLDGAEDIHYFGAHRVAPDLGDAISILEWLYSPPAADGVAAPRVRCLEAADANDDGRVLMDDAVLILQYLFHGTSVPAAPFPIPGMDPEGSPAHLGCEEPLPVFLPHSDESAL